MVPAHSHVGRFENYNFDREALLQKVNNKEDGSFLNYSQLATEFEVKHVNQDSVAKNGGQVVKQYLLENGVDLKRFETKSRTSLVIRKRKRKYNFPFIFHFMNYFIE